MSKPPAMNKQQAQELLWSIDEDTTEDHVQAAIEAGGDPNAESGIGRSPLTAALEDLMPKTGNLMPVLNALLDGGAHPLAGDCAFDRAMTEGTWSSIYLLANKALREDMRTDEGGTVVHVACRQLAGGEQATALLRIIELHDELSRDLEWSDTPLPQQVDEEGNTPLHVLWQEGMALERMEMQGEIEDEEATDGIEVSAQWYATSLLLSRGGDLEACNKAGKTVMQLIRDGLRNGFPQPTSEDLDEANLARLTAAIQHHELDQATGASVHPKPRGKRL